MDDSILVATTRHRNFVHRIVSGSRKNVLRRLTTRSRGAGDAATTLTIEPSHVLASRMNSRRGTKFRKNEGDDAPPAYTYTTPSVGTLLEPASTQSHDDSPYAYLRQFDTVFVIDDSGSMAGRNWQETSDALAAIAPICTQQDTDGIDIYFLNHRSSWSDRDRGAYMNVVTKRAVQDIFSTVRPSGGTPTGTRLSHILRPYLTELQKDRERQSQGQNPRVKPLNIIVITDGVPTDDVESAIVRTARKLDDMDADLWQVEIQFFQVGRNKDAAKELQELDDALSGEYGVRDMVDTVPWNGQDGSTLTAEGIMKVTMGAINRRLDRKQMSSESLFRRVT